MKILFCDRPFKVESSIKDKTGASVTFFTLDDAGMAKKLVDIMEKSGQEAPEELKRMIGQGGNSKFKASRYRSADMSYEDAYRGYDAYGDPRFDFYFETKE